MKIIKHPNLILGIIAVLVILIGIGFKGNGYKSGDYILIGGTALGALHYLWAIIDVSSRHKDDLKAFQKQFWLLVVIAVPALGSLLFYIMHQQKDKIVT